MIAIVCPGQGSQKPGFLAPWLELPEVQRALEEMSEASGINLIEHGTTSDAETIKDTAVAQPLIVAAGLTALHAWQAQTDVLASVAVLSGHSVGEITAAAAAGALSPVDGLQFVTARGRLMAEAAAATETGMAAVVGGEEAEVLAAIEASGCVPANLNGAGQIVAAGTSEQVQALVAAPPAKAKVIALPVAGAFHTEFMAPAVAPLRDLSRSFSVMAPRVPVVSNVDGEALTDGAEVLTRLVSQVQNPVRWDLCMETFKAMGITALIELPPAGTLVNLAKRALPGVATLAVKTPADLDKASDLLREHSGA
ncbi:ACP S-malonyltransferase [Micrococcales bacterium 31B]|nr:ACP S-malonyltransferase [Micrococcales bacterium 31B]